MRSLLWSTATLIILICTAACSTPTPDKRTLEIQDPWARAVNLSAVDAKPTPEGSEETENSGVNSAVYLTIVNSSSTRDQLLSVTCAAADAVEIHKVQMDNDVMSMHPLHSLEIPANSSVELAPGGLHIMLIGLKHNLTAGESLPVTLVFENAGEITIQAEIRAP